MGNVPMSSHVEGLIYAAFVYADKEWPTFALEFQTSGLLEIALSEIRDDKGDWSVIYTGGGRYHLVNRFWLKVVLSSDSFNDLIAKVQVFIKSGGEDGKQTIGHSPA